MNSLKIRITRAGFHRRRTHTLNAGYHFDTERHVSHIVSPPSFVTFLKSRPTSSALASILNSHTDVPTHWSGHPERRCLAEEKFSTDDKIRWGKERKLIAMSFTQKFSCPSGFRDEQQDRRCEKSSKGVHRAGIIMFCAFPLRLSGLVTCNVKVAIAQQKSFNIRSSKEFLSEFRHFYQSNY